MAMATHVPRSAVERPRRLADERRDQRGGVRGREGPADGPPHGRSATGDLAGSVLGIDHVELDPVDQGVVVDRPRVRGAVAQGVAVGLAGSPDVRLGDRRKRDKLDGVDLDQPGTDPVAAASLTCGRFHSRTDSVISPARTSSRNSRLNSTPRTLAGDVPRGTRFRAHHAAERPSLVMTSVFEPRRRLREPERRVGARPQWTYLLLSFESFHLAK